ncbi:MAG: hypothetical protein JNL82_37000 [Myxococcales bacterium]|nr:hypothetical protein [Myxococcales bacterium]
MSLGWAVLISVGYLWIDATEDEVAERRARALDLQAERDRLETGESALALRQEQLRARQEALSRLQGGRRSPTPWLAAVAGAVAGDPGASPFAGEAEPAVRLRELQAADDRRWRVVGTARDVAALTALLRRLKDHPGVAAVAPAEYARGPAGELSFHLVVTARE